MCQTQPAPAAVQPGTYEGNQTEIAAALQLQANGRFRYALSYGALDEQAQGRWEEKDGALLLTTEPQPNPRPSRSSATRRRRTARSM